jgi:hypothetical protein
MDSVMTTMAGGDMTGSDPAIDEVTVSGRERSTPTVGT